jgi:hypothetical protein
VVFPKQGEPFVLNHDEAVVPGERIYWHVSSFNSQVEKVLIKFKDEKKEYFPSPQGISSSFVKDLKFVAYDTTVNNSTVGQALIWADAPAYVGKVVDGYSVYGLDGKSGDVLGASVDPKIIVEGP